MSSASLLLVITSLTIGATPDGTQAAEGDRYWGQWRGPAASGIAADSKPPLTWSEEKNVRWKTDLPGHGLSTPIVWGDMVFIQTAVPVNPKKEEPGDDADAGRGRGEGRDREARRGERGEGPRGEGRRGQGRRRGMRRPPPTDPYKFDVMAFDRRTGVQVWAKTLTEEVPHEGSHRDGSLAPASPVTDGKHLYAYFGSRGLYCLSMTGEVVWKKDLGDMKTRNGFGEGSSPGLFGDTIVINWDHEGESFIVALDKATGKQKWRRDRDEVTSWSTPFLLHDQGRDQVVISAAKRVRSYDLKSGEVIWECGGLGLNCTPTPVVGSGLIFVMSGYRDPALLAISYAGAKGDLTESASVAWRTEKGTSYVPSPLLYGDSLYFLQKNSGILSCVDPKTGRPHYDQQRLEGIDGVYASLVGANDHVYIVGRNGKTVVLKRGPAFETVAVNELDDSFSASPAIVGNELFLRGMKHLYCIAAD